QTGRLAHHLDDLNLLVAGARKHDVELRLLLDGRGRPAASADHAAHHHGGRGGYAELVLQSLLEIRGLEHRHGCELIQQLLGRQSHFTILPSTRDVLCRSQGRLSARGSGGVKNFAASFPAHPRASPARPATRSRLRGTATSAPSRRPEPGSGALPASAAT